MIDSLSNDNHLYPSDVHSLIEDYRLLLQTLGTPTIKHTYKEVNRIVDFVVRNAINSSDVYFV